MPNLDTNLIINRCPHCNIDNPNLILNTRFETIAHNNTNQRTWGIYVCQRCGGVTTASAREDNQTRKMVINEFFPSAVKVEDCLPERAKAYLEQAIDSQHAPAGAIMLAASSIDSMLKNKGYINGNLYSRIDKAAKDHLITLEMATWAHEVRLEANDQRHADEEPELPDSKAAKKVIDFALSQFLYVLPSKVEKGIKQAKEESRQSNDESTSITSSL